MYLFTLVFILLTIFGVFTEIVALQNNRFAAMRSGGAQQMLSWHAAAVTAARYTAGGTLIYPNWGVAGTPCTIIASGQVPAPGMPAVCPDLRPGPGNDMLLDGFVIALPANTPGNTINLLPVGYNANTRFNSVILTDAGGTNTRLAVTFIQPLVTATASDPIAPVGLNTTQLYRQFLRLGVEKFGFGYVVNNQLQPAASLNDIPVAQGGSGAIVNGIYTLPTALVFNAATNPTGPIRSGALALFTPL